MVPRNKRILGPHYCVPSFSLLLFLLSFMEIWVKKAVAQYTLLLCTGSSPSTSCTTQIQWWAIVVVGAYVVCLVEIEFASSQA